RRTDRQSQCPCLHMRCSCPSRSGQRQEGRQAAQPLAGTRSVWPVTRLFSRRALATFLPKTYVKSLPKVSLLAFSVRRVRNSPLLPRTRLCPTETESAPSFRALFPWIFLTTTLTTTTPCLASIYERSG